MPCRDCRFLAVDAAGPRDDRHYPCDVEIGPPPALPACMTAHVPPLHWPPPRTFVRPADGADCAFHQSRDFAR